MKGRVEVKRTLQTQRHTVFRVFPGGEGDKKQKRVTGGKEGRESDSTLERFVRLRAQNRYGRYASIQNPAQQEGPPFRLIWKVRRGTTYRMWARGKAETLL